MACVRRVSYPLPGPRHFPQACAGNGGCGCYHPRESTRTHRLFPTACACARAYLYNAGAVLEAVDRVLHGEAHNAFCAVRPPGHHAGVELHCMGAVSNGFCILNNVALAALYAHHYG